LIILVRVSRASSTRKLIIGVIVAASILRERGTKRGRLFSRKKKKKEGKTDLRGYGNKILLVEI
jgi:hypothetical protein